ncbi:MAG: SDR family oxidoreductase [Clostridia bacterium]|jgi:3-oxoacyl-[acyl-carrier protein] reductase|nr:SDR family oxidoreductase [Clostridia bacterium]
MNYNFEGKVALVTGGTSGIGKEIAKQLLTEGAKVIINYAHNEENYEKTKKEFEEYKEKVWFIKADISKEEEIIKMFSKIERLDFLINNAGTNIDGDIETLDLKDFRKVLEVNLVGKVICTKYAIPLLKNSRNASIVNIASRLGVKPCAEASAYCASEAGIINFTMAVALELSKYNIRVNAVSPSLTITPLALEGWTEEEIEEQKQSNPLKRLGETIDIANAVLFLLSDKASYINGENLNVNGGGLLN